MSKRNRIGKIFLTIATVLLGVSSFGTVRAASSSTVSLAGASQVNTGSSFSINLAATATTGGGALMSVGGKVEIEDTSCISLAGIEVANNLGFASDGLFAYSNMSGEAKAFNPVKINLKAGNAACKTKITVKGKTDEFIQLSYTDSSKIKQPSVTKEIEVVVPAPKSDDNDLKSLAPNIGTLAPAFASNTTSYTMTVPAGTTSIKFTAAPNDSKATVSGTTCNISSNTTTCNITVKSESGKNKVYSVKVTREEEQKPDEPDKPDEPEEPEPPVTLSGDATLKSLDVSGFSLTPSFKPDTTTYNMTVSNDVTGLDVSAIANDPNAKVEISGNSNWKEGVNPVTITVTAEDGTQKVYIINVTRRALNNTSKPQSDPKSSDNFLKELVVSNGDVTPSFDRNINSYSIIVPNDVTSLDLSAIANDSNANVEITGNSDFKVESLNTVTIKVTAEDGSQRVYTINVTRSDKKAENKLEKLEIKNGEINPTFSPDNFTYDVTVNSKTDKLDITAIPEFKDSTVEIIGNENLKEGNNTVLVKVTDKNGFVQYYRLNVKKSEPKKFLGLTLKGWLILLGLLLLFGLIFFLILLLVRRKKDEKNETIITNEKQAPVIEFKPEFNFSSKNGTDDDIVEAGGVLNQYTGNSGSIPEPEKKVITEAKISEPEEVPYDPYDDIVTKEELMDAIEEAKKTHDSSKLKMLYAQEVLNRQKEALKEKDKK